MANYFIGKKEIDGPRIKGDPIRRYYFNILDTPIHYHEDFEIIRVIKGTLKYHVGTSEIIAHEDDIVMITPYVLHSGSVWDKNFSVSVYVVKPDFISSENEYIKKYFDPLINRECFFPAVIRKGEKNQDKLLSCLDRIDNIENERENGFELLLRNEITNYFVILYQSNYLLEIKESESKNEKLIKKAIAYIEQNYSHHISINEISKYIGFSESHFMSLFRQHTGMSFITYLNGIRIEKAISLLEKTNISIIEISEKTGFNSISLFNRTFKKTTGKTPKQYR